MILLGLWFRESSGEQGFYRASTEVDEGIDGDTDTTPWLVFCWLLAVAEGFRRSHAVLCQYFDFSQIRVVDKGIQALWQEVNDYLFALIGGRGSSWPDQIRLATRVYSQQTGGFLFGTPSQSRTAKGIRKSA